MKTIFCVALILAGSFAAPPERLEPKQVKQPSQIIVQKPAQEPQYYYKPISYYPQYVSPEQYSSQYYQTNLPIYTTSGHVLGSPVIKAAYTYPFYTFPSVSSAPLVTYDYKAPVVESH
uniref:Uncharacterized protein n=1 Tax=Megaselia scalaris TaxID=36166 RepID=T1H1X8_MEGSC